LIDFIGDLKIRGKIEESTKNQSLRVFVVKSTTNDRQQINHAIVQHFLFEGFIRCLPLVVLRRFEKWEVNIKKYI